MEKATAPIQKVPRHILKLALHLASVMERGHAYEVTVFMPQSSSAEPTWNVVDRGQVQNQK